MVYRKSQVSPVTVTEEVSVSLTIQTLLFYIAFDPTVLF